MAFEVKEALEGVNKGLVDLQAKITERDDQIRKLGAADALTREELQKMHTGLDEKEVKFDVLKKELEIQTNRVKDIELSIKERRQHSGGNGTEEKFDIVRAIRGLSTKEWDRDLEKRLLCRRDSKTQLRGKALIDETGGSGGHYLVPDEFVSEIIPLLYGATVFDKLPVRKFTPSGGTVRFPKMTGGCTAYMVGVATAITASNPTISYAPMTPHKVAALVPIDNDLIRRSDPAVGNIVRQDMLKQAALKAELQYLYGDGQAPNLSGIFLASGINSVSMGADGAKFSAANNIDKLMQTVREVEMDNGVMEGWVFNARTKWDIREVKTAQGNYILTLANNAGDPPMLLGYPYYATNQIPNNVTQGQNADTTFLLAGQWSDIITAVWTGIEIVTSTEGSYVVGGVTYSALQDDLTIIRLIFEIDILVRHAASMCKLIGIRSNYA